MDVGGRLAGTGQFGIRYDSLQAIQSRPVVTHM